MSYTVNCSKCGQPFKKFSIIASHRRCPDCLPKHMGKQNVYSQLTKRSEQKQPTGFEKAVWREIERLSQSLEKLIKTQEMSFDAMQVEMHLKLDELCAEVIESHLQSIRNDFSDSTKETKQKVQTSLATINTRVKKSFDAVEHDMDILFEVTGRNLSPQEKQGKELSRKLGREEK